MEITFTNREKEVLKYLADGMTTKEMAVIMGVSEKAVEKHRCNIKIKAGN